MIIADISVVAAGVVVGLDSLVDVNIVVVDCLLWLFLTHLWLLLLLLLYQYWCWLISCCDLVVVLAVE